jgi:DNA polymerase
MWHGATTGRFAGKGPQIQNYPRDSYPDFDVNTIIELSNEDIEEMYAPVRQAASKCLRGMLLADSGKLLIAADFEQIEYRVLAWLAGEQKVLDMLQEKEAMIYEKTAAYIYKKPYLQISKDERQIGKVCNLALGYQGWINALVSMATAYNLTLPDTEECTRIMTEWRCSRPATVKFWHNLEDAAMRTVKTGKPHSVGRIKFGIQHGFLRMLLPSGRMISYYKPEIQKKKTPYGVEKEVVTFLVNRAKGKSGVTAFIRDSTYGGKLAENATQAVSADILIESMKRVEDKNIPVVFHVHDEVVCEIIKNSISLEKFESLISVLPMWADGLPLAASGWIGERYRK